MKNKNIIEITINPLDNQSGNLDLTVCIQQLSDLEKVLKKTAEKISPKKPVKLRLTKASKNSPFNVGIAVECENPRIQEKVISMTKIDMDIINTGDITENNLEHDTLQCYKKLSKFHTRKNDRHETTISFPDNEVITVNKNFAENIDLFLGENDSCISSYEGELEKINLHNEINCFFIYPYSAPKKIKCTFPEKLRDIAIDGIGRKVCITGKAIYKKKQDFPYLIKVKEIDVYPPETELPNWNDLLGIAPKATGELLSEEFVRKLRNDWG